MFFTHRYLFFLFICCWSLIFSGQHLYAQGLPASQRICGDWENQAKSLRVRIYTERQEFKAKIIWFSDTEGKPMNYWKDKRNPDPRMRNRTILGMSILRGLEYDASQGTWENGKVYDSKHGKEWNASASINKNGLLKVRGYWHFKWIGRTMIFHRI